MQVPQRGRREMGRRRRFAAGLWVLPLLVGGVGAGFAKTKAPVAETRLSLDDLGFPGVSAAFLNSGSSIATLNFVDSEHLLFTYTTRGLVPRVVDDPPDHEDRMVAAKLLELPSGKVVAETQWHLHDHGRYLWSLGEGRFLLRVGDALSTFAPMANLAAGQAFERISFSHRAGVVEMVVVSDDHKILTVETSTPTAKVAVVDPKIAAAKAAEAARPHFATSANGEPPPPPPPPAEPVQPVAGPVILEFYRLSGKGSLESPLVLKRAGALRSPVMLALPIDEDGYLRPTSQQNSVWSVEFHPFGGGKNIALAPIESSCPPAVERVGPGQLVSINCRGITGRVGLVAYDFDKHVVWQETLDASPLPPAFALAPTVGRFAISRFNSDQTQAALVSNPDTSASQYVRVYQTQTGDLLLKLDCTPVYRTAENFDLAPDGMRVAVIRGGAIEVYRLPELTALDRADLAELGKFSFAPAEGDFDLSGVAEVARKSEVTATTIVSGDSQAARPKPTLLKPGEKAEFPDKSGTD
jgi:hypothetical protein